MNSLSSLQQKPAARAATWRRGVRSLRACLGTLAAARWLALATVVALALPGAADATVYYPVFSSGTSVGADGSTNLPSGNTASGTWRTLLSTTAPTGTDTSIAGAPASTTLYTLIGTAYLSANYASATTIAANPTASVWLQSTTTTNERFQLDLVDYDPLGAAGNGAPIATITGVASPGATATLTPVTLTGVAYQVPQGHRLALRVSFKPRTAGDVGQLWCNSTARSSSFTVVETAAPGTPGTPTFTSIADTTLTVNWTAATGSPTGYKVERAPDVSGSAGTYAEVGTGVLSPWADPGPLTASTKYWYRVRGTNAAGDGAYSTAASVTTTGAAVPPGAPGTPSFSAITQTTVSLSWTVATGASTYKVERAPDVSGSAGTYAQVASAVGGTSWADPGPLAPATKYWYRVRGTNTAGDGAYSAGASVTTAGPVGTPGAPTFSSVTTSTLTVGWSAAANAATYKVERAPDSAGTPGTFSQVASAVAATSWADPGPLAAGTTYWYRVRGTDSGGVDGPYSAPANVTTAVAVPGAPGTPTFSSVAQATLTVSWTAATGAASYKVERAPDNSGVAGTYLQIAFGVLGTSYPDSGLTANTKYWYRVRGTNTGGDGAYGAGASVTTLVAVPGAPGTPTFSAIGQTSVTVSWTAATGSPTGYKLERALDLGGAPGVFSQIFAPAATSQPDSGLTPGAKYWYRVRATNAGGDGAYGAAASVTMLPATTALGDGTNPSAASICPGAAATPIDAFTLSSTGVADSISSVMVSLSPAGAYLNVGTVEVTDDAGSSVKGSATPTGNSVLVNLGSAIASPLGSTQYKLRITPKTHAAMPAAASGQTFATTAIVAAITGVNPGPTYGDSASGTITVDNRSPADATWGAVGTASASVTLNWTNPTDPDLNQVIVLRKAGGPVTDVPVEGSTYVATNLIGASTVVYVGTGTTSNALAVTNGTSYYFKIFAKDGCGNYSAGVQVGPIVTTVTGTAGVEGDTTRGTQKPTLSILNPGKNTAVSGTFKVQVRVFNPNTAEAISLSGLSLNTDGTTSFPVLPTANVSAFTPNAKYGAATNSGVFEATVTGLAAGSYTLRARATNAAGSTSSAAVAIRVNPSTAKGGGTLLRRDNSSQLCNDCHQLKSHSSETAGSKHGSWSTACADCHSPHGTTNVFLVDDLITPPAVNGYQPPRAVYFSKTTGFSPVAGATNRTTATFANLDNTGPCQACHTRTASATGTPRFQNVGADDGHYTKEPTTVPASTLTCTSCHSHTNGFSAIPGGQCKDCHLTAGVDVDDYLWNGTKATIDSSAWTTRGHGLAAASTYASGNPGANFDAQGAMRGDRGCLYCHTSSTSHGDPKNYFRLANTETALGPNGTCKICHDVKPGVATGYDPDGAGTDYPLINGTKLVSFNHEGSRHLPASGNHSGGIYCWDCHDPHGDSTQHFMMQAKLVQNSIPAGTVTLPAPPYADMWGTPNPAVPTVTYGGTYDFIKATAGTLTTSDPLKYDYEDYYLNGFCRVCHDAPTTTPAPCTASAPCGVSYYNKAAATCGTAGSGCVGAGNGTQYHPTSLSAGSRRRCTDCHVHKLSCGGCHVAPPTTGVHGQHNQRIATDQDVDYTAPDTEATNALYGFRCVKCHNEDHMTLLDDLVRGKSSGNPYPIGVLFSDTADPKNPNPPATYTSGAPPASGSPYQSITPAGQWFAWTIGTCASVYCHSNGAPAGGVAVAYKNLTWTPGGGLGTWSCTSCHGDNVTATATMSTAHTLHFATGYAYGCAKCHLSVASSNTALNTSYVGGGKFLHVNGVKDVKFDTFQGQGAGTYDGVGRTCSNTYCHSNGVVRGAASYTSGPSIAWTTTGQPTCTACHGGDATTGTSVIAGVLKGGTAAHTKHVNNTTAIGVNVTCGACHSATVSTASNTAVTGRASHVDGSPSVSLATITSPTSKVRSGGTATGTSPATTCASNWCHSTGQETLTPTSVAWNATAWSSVCKGCHGTGVASLAGEPDYTGNTNRHNAKHIPQASAAVAAAACVRCHATTVTTAGTAILTTTPSKHLDGDRDVSFANVGSNPGGSGTPYNATTKSCQAYCHSNATPLGGTASYATVTWDQATAVGCPSCHGGKDASTTMSASHGKHINSAVGSYSYGCPKCHWATTQVDGVILATSTKHVDGVKTDASFDLTWPGPPTWAQQTNAAYNASTHQCSNTYCHGSFPGGVGANTVTWNSTVTCTSCHGNPPPDSTHASVAAGANCGGCHVEAGYTATTVNYTAHANGAKTGGGGCLGCHGGQKVNRRNVVPDFALQSHHVRTGGATTAKLTDNDCVVCHAEGDATAQGAKPTTNDWNASTNPTGTHYNKVIDLRDADTGAIYVFDKDAIRSAVAATASWGSQAQRWREETSGVYEGSTVPPWVAGTHGLDAFCLSCHDSNGAVQSSQKGDVGASAPNPFYDDAIQNGYDTLVRPVVVDIKSRVSALGSSDLDSVTNGLANDGINDPPKGVNARHAIRGQSLSVYKTYSGTTLYTGNATTGATLTAPTLIGVQEVIKIPGTTTNAYTTPASTTPLWSDRSVMGCADCHTVDGGNQPADLNAPTGIYGNAHGSSSEYMLKDGSGGAAEGSYASRNYVCYRCHKVTWYIEKAHTPNGSDWAGDSTLCNITNRVSSACSGGGNGSNWSGNACMSCHGGFERTGGVFKGFGSIHGNSASVPTNSANSAVDCEVSFNATTCHRAFRFMNGASMRYFNPQDWNLAPQNCVTLASKTSDAFGACSAHDGTGYSRSRPLPRSLRY